MITPSFALTATERILPRMALDFTTAALDSRVTFTRAGNTATVTNSSGVIVGINANLPRFDYNPVTLACLGLLIEESRTNELLNSLIDGTSLVTQLVTVTAAARTLSFYGTGQVVLSGAHSATVTGSGAYPVRTTLTFTPSAGSLTLTVTGTVQFAQLELGAFATSFIPTAASQVTRTADVATMTGTDFSDWFNATEGAFLFECTAPVTGSSVFIGTVSDGTTTDRIRYMYNTGSMMISVVGGVSQASIDGGTITVNVLNKLCAAYEEDNYGVSANGNATVTDLSGTIPTMNQCVWGSSGTQSFLNGHLSKISYYSQRIIDSEIQAFSKG
jgi:hypothetical protein